MRFITACFLKMIYTFQEYMQLFILWRILNVNFQILYKFNSFCNAKVALMP